MTAQVLSTAANATLSVADPSSDEHRPPRQRHVLPAGGARGRRDAHRPPVDDDGAGRRHRAAPTTLLTYDVTAGVETITLRFKQNIAVTDALRTGAYAKTLTFTLSTTAP